MPQQGVGGDSAGNFAKLFGTHKMRMIGLPCGEETMTICVAVSIEYRNVTDGRTDRQIDVRTDGLTDRQNCYINIARQCADAR